MKKYWHICFILGILLSITIPVNAEIKCDREEKQRLKSLAEKIEFTFDYVLKDVVSETGRKAKEPIFTITATNLNRDLKVTIMEDYFMDRYREFKDGDKPTASLSGFLSGERVPITIYGFVPNGCSGQQIHKVSIKIPYYNVYSTDARCEEYPDFKYCADLLNAPVRESVFEDELKRFISEQEKVEEPEITKKVDFVIILGIVGGVILVATIVAIIVWKRRKKYSL